MIEILVAIFVFALVMAGTLSGYMFIVRGRARQMLQMDLITDAQQITTLLRTSFRISGKGEMLTYPANAPYSAISYPSPGSTNAAGDAVLDAAGKLVWRETIILHAWPPDAPTELRMTRFNPRDNTLSGAERAEQLETVVQDGHGANAVNGANSTTRVLSALQPRFDARLDGRTYNFYAPEDTKEANVVLGGVRVLPGLNSIRFRAEDQVDESGGYGFRLDQIRLSPAGLPIEAEALSIVSQSGTSATIIEDAAGGWSDYRALEFPATSADDEIEFSYYNDTWHETRFQSAGGTFDKCMAVTDVLPGNMGTVLRPTGRDLAWAAEFQSGAVGSGASLNPIQGAAVRVIVRGGNAQFGPHVLAAGDGCRVTFRASDHPGTAFYILDAFIAEAANQTAPGADVIGSTTTRLRFGTPDSQRNWALIMNGEIAQTVPATFPVELLKSYVVSYRVSPLLAGNPWMWAGTGATNRFDSYMIPGSSWPNTTATSAAQWSGRTDLVAMPAILGVSAIDTTYPNVATYSSRIVDTCLTAPDYQDLAWLATQPSADTSVTLKVRTGNQADLTDAQNWDQIAALTTSGTAIPAAAGNGRYVQVQVILGRDRTRDLVPDFSHFTMRWLGEPAYLDFGGAFGRSADGGIVEVLVNGEPPLSSVRTDLTVSGSHPTGFRSSWALGIEISPRN
jgi:hypothetical protein